MKLEQSVHIIGGGLAGCEAAWQLINLGIPVILHEMRPQVMTEAHRTSCLAELVCSNSFRSDDAGQNCVGLLHQELRTLKSLIMDKADQQRVPAGGALAVDRDSFSQAIETSLLENPLFSLCREEITDIPETWEHVIIASGPLTSRALSELILQKSGQNSLAFFDAIAPIIYRESIDMNIVWMQSRYDKGETEGDYINCPLTKEQYDHFIEALIQGEKITFKDWEEKTPYFSGCLPIEVMAERGTETLRWGPMKPVGLTNPHAPDIKPYAIVQLRLDNKLGTLYNMVGFQTKLKHSEQIRIFRTIPGLENAEFARLGGMHRNTYLNSPKILDSFLCLKHEKRLSFAGQITGCEGYVESTAIGLLAGLFMAARISKCAIPAPPPTTAIGALLHHITGGHNSQDLESESLSVTDKTPLSFQPMNVNFGLFPPLLHQPKGENGKRLRGSEKAKAKKQALTDRARNDLQPWLGDISKLWDISKLSGAMPIKL